MKIEATPKELSDFVSLLQNQKINSNDKPLTISAPQINLARMAKKSRSIKQVTESEPKIDLLRMAAAFSQRNPLQE